MVSLFYILSAKVEVKLLSKTEKHQPKFKQITVMLILTVFQVMSLICILVNEGLYNNYVDKFSGEAVDLLSRQSFCVQAVYLFLAYLTIEWVYMAAGTFITGGDYFELEAIAFFLCGIGLTICTSFRPSVAKTQLIAIVLGLAVYLAVLLLIKDVNFACFLRTPAAIGSVGLLAITFILAPEINGTKSWLQFGGFSFQSSELVKIVFILVGAVSLEKLLSIVSLTKYLMFSGACVGMLFLMKDFGTALIFFFTFILIAFMRSGDLRTIILICSAALMGAILILVFFDTVRGRFESYRHVWEYADSKGYQQTRVLTYMSSGGLLGLGIGEGRLRNIYAASCDLVFGVICEEFGLIVGLLVLLAFAGIAVFAIHASKTAGSTFYAIAAVSAAGMLLFQTSLNVFGITDLLPLTGVTLPFISEGGSSMICCWGLLAYIRAAGAPFVPPEADPRPKIIQRGRPQRPANPTGRTRRKGGAA